MHAFIKLLTFIVIGALGYISISIFLHPEVYDDTIVYEEITEEIYTAPEVEEIATTTATTTTPKKVEEPTKEIIIPVVEEKPIIVEKALPPTPITVEEESTEEPLSFGDINTTTREALVNIFCLTKGPHQYIAPISGSGTIIDERGVIITNAHIAQFYLFKDFPTEDFVNCLIRTGSPAKATYKAELLYISPEWIGENAEAISSETPVGTGEDDYAFLLITEPLSNQILPGVFPHVPFDTAQNMITKGDPLLVGGYPAGFLGGRTVQQDLYASTAVTEAIELYTFDETGALDLVSLGGTVVAQQGASGGPAINEYGNMIGLISTASEGETTKERDLRAITFEHIERSLEENNKTTLLELLSGDLKAKAAAFNETAAPTLLQILLNSF